MVAELPGPAVSAQRYSEGVDGRRILGAQPFGPAPAATAGAGRLYYTTGSEPEIVAVDSLGTVRLRIRTTKPLRRVTDDLIEAHVDRVLEAAPADASVRRRWRDQLEGAPYPEQVPPYSSLTVDRVGMIWARAYPDPAADSVAWSVFDPGGQWLVDVRMPESWQIQEIGQDYVLVLVQDDPGVERLSIHALDRLPAP